MEHKEHKYTLLEALRKAVSLQAPEAELAAMTMTPEGFMADFDMETPLNKDRFVAIDATFQQLCPQEGCQQLDQYAGVYENGNADGKVLQRIYVLSFPKEKDLHDFLARREEAKAWDHRRLGASLDLFSTSGEIGPGLILWHPKGAVLRMLMEQFSQGAHLLNGYQWVYSPHIGKGQLWKTSGHLDFYKDSMYSPLDVEGDAYYLKPMNCPFHIAIYQSKLRSYRDLPLRYAELGTVYRYELSGTLSGLTRMRGFTQDDAHIICTESQIEKEVSDALAFTLYVLKAFGFESFQAYLSTKPQGKSIGSEKDWKIATAVLEGAVKKAGLSYTVDEGGGAFYGPKIDIKLTDSLGRQWQCGTIQFDFNLPGRFAMGYHGEDGHVHTPFMVHRALFGSLERFSALLIEHYKGDFPLWLSPVQAAIVPVAPRHNEACKRLEIALRRLGLRPEANYSDLHMREKIKRFQLEKIPYLMVVGDREADQGAFSLRSRRDGEMGTMTAEGFLSLIQPELDKGKPDYILA